MTVESGSNGMTKARCVGCHNDDYNHGLGCASECWNFKDAKVIKRKKVSVYQTPPWTQPADDFPSCYRRTGYVFVGEHQER